MVENTCAHRVDCFNCIKSRNCQYDMQLSRCNQLDYCDLGIHAPMLNFIRRNKIDEVFAVLDIFGPAARLGKSGT